MQDLACLHCIKQLQTAFLRAFIASGFKLALSCKQLRCSHRNESVTQWEMRWEMMHSRSPTSYSHTVVSSVLSDLIYLSVFFFSLAELSQRRSPCKEFCSPKVGQLCITLADIKYHQSHTRMLFLHV